MQYLSNRFLLSTAKVRKDGKMVPNMKVIGEMVWQKDKVHFIMQTVMFIQENFTKTAQMDLVSIYILMDKNMLAFGKMICKTVQEKKN